MWSLKMTTSNWEAFSRNHWFILHQDYKGFNFVYRILFWIQVHSRERLDNCRQTISCSSTLSKTERRNRWGNWNLWWILCSLREDILQDIKKEPIYDTFFRKVEKIMKMTGLSTKTSCVNRYRNIVSWNQNLHVLME